jgi:SAM-dependent methyltransferase
LDAKEIKQGRIYSDFPHLMRLISPPEEYEEEAAHWREVLRDKLGQGRHTILELGVGGGHNLSHLTSEFDAVAVDISEVMLEECRKLNHGVELYLGDMRSIRFLRLGKSRYFQRPFFNV